MTKLKTSTSTASYLQEVGAAAAAAVAHTGEAPQTLQEQVLTNSNNNLNLSSSNNNNHRQLEHNKWWRSCWNGNQLDGELLYRTIKAQQERRLAHQLNQRHQVQVHQRLSPQPDASPVANYAYSVPRRQVRPEAAERRCSSQSPQGSSGGSSSSPVRDELPAAELIDEEDDPLSDPLYASILGTGRRAQALVSSGSKSELSAAAATCSPPPKAAARQVLSTSTTGHSNSDSASEQLRSLVERCLEVQRATRQSSQLLSDASYLHLQRQPPEVVNHQEESSEAISNSEHPKLSSSSSSSNEDTHRATCPDQPTTIDHLNYDENDDEDEAQMKLLQLNGQQEPERQQQVAAGNAPTMSAGQPTGGLAAAASASAAKDHSGRALSGTEGDDKLASARSTDAPGEPEHQPAQPATPPPRLSCSVAAATMLEQQKGELQSSQVETMSVDAASATAEQRSAGERHTKEQERQVNAALLQPGSPAGGDTGEDQHDESSANEIVIDSSSMRRFHESSPIRVRAFDHSTTTPAPTTCSSQLSSSSAETMIAATASPATCNPQDHHQQVVAAEQERKPSSHEAAKKQQQQQQNNDRNQLIEAAKRNDLVSFFEQHRGASWRLRQLAHQIPHQDIKLLASSQAHNHRLSGGDARGWSEEFTQSADEIKFIRSQRKLASQFKASLYYLNPVQSGGGGGCKSVNDSSRSSSRGAKKQTCFKCKLPIEADTTCVRVDNLQVNTDTADYQLTDDTTPGCHNSGSSNNNNNNSSQQHQPVKTDGQQADAILPAKSAPSSSSCDEGVGTSSSSAQSSTAGSHCDDRETPPHVADESPAARSGGATANDHLSAIRRCNAERPLLGSARSCDNLQLSLDSLDISNDNHRDYLRAKNCSSVIAQSSSSSSKTKRKSRTLTWSASLSSFGASFRFGSSSSSQPAAQKSPKEPLQQTSAVEVTTTSPAVPNNKQEPLVKEQPGEHQQHQQQQNTTTGQTILFHTDCFSCATCNELLVDLRALIYFNEPQHHQHHHHHPQQPVKPNLQQQQQHSTDCEYVNLPADQEEEDEQVQQQQQQHSTKSPEGAKQHVALLQQQQISLYCHRHFVELFKPRCQQCDCLILDEECTEAEGKVWHIKHFCCTECRVPLGGQQYIIVDQSQAATTGAAGGLYKHRRPTPDTGRATGNNAPTNAPYCLTCFDRVFGDTCEQCGKLITCDLGAINHEQRCWHASPGCFKCQRCNKSLLGSPFLPSADGRIYCSLQCSESANVVSSSSSPTCNGSREAQSPVKGNRLPAQRPVTAQSNNNLLTNNKQFAYKASQCSPAASLLSNDGTISDHSATSSGVSTAPLVSSASGSLKSHSPLSSTSSHSSVSSANGVTSVSAAAAAAAAAASSGTTALSTSSAVTATRAPVAGGVGGEGGGGGGGSIEAPEASGLNRPRQINSVAAMLERRRRVQPITELSALDLLSAADDHLQQVTPRTGDGFDQLVSHFESSRRFPQQQQVRLPLIGRANTASDPKHQESFFFELAQRLPKQQQPQQRPVSVEQASRTALPLDTNGLPEVEPESRAAPLTTTSQSAPCRTITDHYSTVNKPPRQQQQQKQALQVQQQVSSGANDFFAITSPLLSCKTDLEPSQPLRPTSSLSVLTPAATGEPRATCCNTGGLLHAASFSTSSLNRPQQMGDAMNNHDSLLLQPGAAINSAAAANAAKLTKPAKSVSFDPTVKDPPSSSGSLTLGRASALKSALKTPGNWLQHQQQVVGSNATMPASLAAHFRSAGSLSAYSAYYDEHGRRIKVSSLLNPQADGRAYFGVPGATEASELPEPTNRSRSLFSGALAKLSLGVGQSSRGGRREERKLRAQQPAVVGPVPQMLEQSGVGGPIFVQPVSQFGVSATPIGPLPTASTSQQAMMMPVQQLEQPDRGHTHRSRHVRRSSGRRPSGSSRRSSSRRRSARRSRRYCDDTDCYDSESESCSTCSSSGSSSDADSASDTDDESRCSSDDDNRRRHHRRRRRRSTNSYSSRASYTSCSSRSSASSNSDSTSDTDHSASSHSSSRSSSRSSSCSSSQCSSAERAAVPVSTTRSRRSGGSRRNQQSCRTNRRRSKGGHHSSGNERRHSGSQHRSSRHSGSQHRSRRRSSRSSSRSSSSRSTVRRSTGGSARHRQREHRQHGGSGRASGARHLQTLTTNR